MATPKITGVDLKAFNGVANLFVERPVVVCEEYVVFLWVIH